MAKRSGGGRLSVVVLVTAAMILLSGIARASDTDRQDEQLAVSLAELLRSARGVISSNQDLINNPEIGDKGLTGEVVLAEALKRYQKTTGQDLSKVDETTRYGRAITALKRSIVAVTNEHQSTINMPGVGFKGVIPAVFARLVNERFDELMKGEAEMKITAPRELVRNRKTVPDQWETEIMETKLLSPDWPKGQPFAGSRRVRGRDAFRFLIPEYYQASCLVCHGQPKGELDITGYPKEGGSEGSLGAVISVTLYRQEAN